jgi:hypothetical protein
MKNTHKDFLIFLENINLIEYRKKFSGYRAVEENLPKNIQILSLIYETYWNQRNFLSFDDFFDLFFKEKENDLRNYNKKRNNEDPDADNPSVFKLFLKNFKARQYRTWASIIAQIQLGLLLEEKYLEKKIEMSQELDNSGVDIRIVDKIDETDIIDLGLKKETKRKDINTKTSEKEGVKSIKYFVPKFDDIINNKKKNGEFKKPYNDFMKDETLSVLKNGFIIFTEKISQKIF